MAFLPRFVLLLGCLVTVSPTLGEAQASSFPDAFSPGERLLFDGKLGLLRLGRASMTVLPDDTIQGLPARHFQLAISASLMTVYRIDDRFDSWVSQPDGLSRRFIQQYDESNQKRRNEYDIFPDSGFYRQSGIDSAMPSVAAPLDETAFLYWVRTLDMDVGDTLVLARYFRPDRNPVTVAVIARDTVDVPAGRFATLVLHPVIPDGGLLFSEKADARIWISEDPRRLVVQMKVKLMSRLTVALTLREVLGPETAGAGTRPR